MNKQCLAAAVAGCVSIWSSLAAASAPHTHDGFYFQGNIGPGYLTTSPAADEGADIDIKYSGFGVGGGLLFGGTPAPGLVIGGGTANVVALSPKITVEGEESDLGDGDLTLNLSTLGVFGTYYPDPNAGLNLHLMVAYGVLSVSDSDGDDSDNNPSGVAITAGVGYDFWVAQEWSIGVLGRFTYAALSYEDVSFPTLAPALLATFTYH
jgi:opacity protein-like surface antigen